MLDLFKTVKGLSLALYLDWYRQACLESRWIVCMHHGVQVTAAACQWTFCTVFLLLFFPLLIHNVYGEQYYSSKSLTRQRHWDNNNFGAIGMLHVYWTSWQARASFVGIGKLFSSPAFTISSAESQSDSCKGLIQDGSSGRRCSILLASSLR